MPTLLIRHGLCQRNEHVGRWIVAGVTREFVNQLTGCHLTATGAGSAGVLTRGFRRGELPAFLYKTGSSRYDVCSHRGNRGARSFVHSSQSRTNREHNPDSC
jgi:hypothetical protein